MTKIFKPERIPISKLDGVSEKSIQDMIAAFGAEIKLNPTFIGKLIQLARISVNRYIRW